MDNEPFHPLAWSAWLVAAALPALLTRNPLYLSLALAAIGVTYLALAGRNPLAASWSTFVRFGAILWLFTIPFTALTAHYGNLVLFRLPEHWPVIGGAITAESLLYGLSSGLSLIALLLAFASFNVAVDQARLLRLTPSFMYQLGIVAAIAVGFVPQMVATWQAIQEAQRVRGHRVRGLRDLMPLIMPLLVTALERAVQLAESMEARGFGRQAIDEGTGQRIAHQLAILTGLLCLSVGLAGLGFWPTQRTLVAILCGIGVLALLWAFWDSGRRVKRTRYRRWHWSANDRMVGAIGLGVVLAWLAIWVLRSEWIFYYPYPPYSPVPTFQPLLGMTILALGLPGLLLAPVKRQAPIVDKGNS